MTPTRMQQQLSDQLVQAMYREFHLDSLQEILSIGEEYESANPRAEVVAMNISLRAEIERRIQESAA